MRATLLQTPGFFWPPMPTGQLTAGPAADPLRPLLRNLGQVIREDEARTRTVGAADDGNPDLRQPELRIQRPDRRIVPRRDFAEEDVGERFAVEPERIRLHAAQIDHDHHAAGQHRELAEAGFVELFSGQRIVGAAEIDGPVPDLIDAGAGTAALIVDLDPVAGRFAVIVGPDPVNRGRKRGAGAADRKVGGGNGERQRQRQSRKRGTEQILLHMHSIRLDYPGTKHRCGLPGYMQIT